MPYIPNDDCGEILEFTKEYFILRYFYKDSQCTKPSTRFRGEYQKIIKYSFENPRPHVKVWLNDLVDLKNPYPARGEGRDYNCFIESGDAILVSEMIEKNPEYDLEYWQKLYEESLEAIAQAEAEGYRTY